MDKVQQFAAEVASILNDRVDNAPNDNFATNMKREAKSFANSAVIGYMMNHALPAEPLKDMAIYAVQKVSRLIEYGIGATSKIDGFTDAILKNALALSKKSIAFSPELQLASLSTRCDAPEKLSLAIRRTGAPSTASTQASTTRIALEYLGIAKVGAKRVLEVDLTHPLVTKYLGLEEAAGGSVDEISEEDLDAITVHLETEAVTPAVPTKTHHKYKGKNPTTVIDQAMAAGALESEL